MAAVAAVAVIGAEAVAAVAALAVAPVAAVVAVVAALAVTVEVAAASRVASGRALAPLCVVNVVVLRGRVRRKNVAHLQHRRRE